MADQIPLRITLLDTWDELRASFPSATPISRVKEAALAHSGIRRPASDYVVKYNGGELYENGTTLADVKVIPNSALIVLRRRRDPVR